MAKRFPLIAVIYACLLFTSCNQSIDFTADVASEAKTTVINKKEFTTHSDVLPKAIPYDTAINTIHIRVALCDNRYQGIMPVPEKIGNGQDPRYNLFWGCGYGVKTFFKRSIDWTLVKSQSIDTIIMERLVFKHRSANYYLVADAYNGKHIKHCTKEFLQSSSGSLTDTVMLNGKALGIAGNAKLSAYIGHNGLMDFDIPGNFSNVDGKKRDVMMLACSSRYYFEQKFDQHYVHPIVWTKALMAPEAYTIHDAIGAYIKAQPDSEILEAAISAYAKYQKCGKKGASTILVSGY